MFYKKKNNTSNIFLNICNSYLQFKTVGNNCNNAISIIKMLQNIFFSSCWKIGKWIFFSSPEG